MLMFTTPMRNDMPQVFYLCIAVMALLPTPNNVMPAKIMVLTQALPCGPTSCGENGSVVRAALLRIILYSGNLKLHKL